MKKTYMNPKMDVIEIKGHQMLLAGSTPELGGTYGGGTILAPELTLDDDFDE